MKLSQHDLQQLDEDAVRRLPEAALRHLSQTLLADLKEACERLAQNPRNSSRPPSSRPPWEGGTPAAEPAPAATAPEPAALTPDRSRADAPEAGTPPPGAATSPGRRAGQAVKRKPGKQPGAPGVGRTQVFTAHHTEEHRPTVCARCGQPLSAAAAAVSYTGFQALDLHWGDPAAPGLRLHIIDHRYLEVTCPCGHHSRAQPAQGDAAELGAIAVREWRLWGQVWPP